jgi:hypothetical protein
MDGAPSEVQRVLVTGVESSLAAAESAIAGELHRGRVSEARKGHFQAQAWPPGKVEATKCQKQNFSEQKKANQCKLLRAPAVIHSQTQWRCRPALPTADKAVAPTPSTL